MVNDREGISGLFQNYTSDNSSINPGFIPSNPIIVGRVIDIILNDLHPKFKVSGGGKSIGTIFFEPVSKLITGGGNIIKAKPLFPNIKNFPIINEIVLIISSPNSFTNTNDYKTTMYYISGINVWNSPHYNALPSPIKSQNSTNFPQNTFNVPIQSPSNNIESEFNPNTPYNPSQQTFVEKDNIYPLQPYTGDIIYEGRFGQSIRFGNTAKGTNNTWSSTGNNGDPIMIIRNGQNPEINTDGWVPTIENINKDLSTVYLTSTQKLEDVDNNTVSRFTGFNTTSTKNPIKTLNEYTGPQIFANTDRIVLNAKNDSIFIGSKRDINISTDESINIASQNLRVEIGNIQLGGEGATQAIVLGNTFMEELNTLLQGLNNFCQLLSVAKDKEGAPYTSINLPASSLKTQIDFFQRKIKNKTFLSSYSFTK